MTGLGGVAAIGFSAELKEEAASSFSGLRLERARGKIEDSVAWREWVGNGPLFLSAVCLLLLHFLIIIIIYIFLLLLVMVVLDSIAAFATDRIVAAGVAHAVTGLVGRGFCVPHQR